MATRLYGPPTENIDVFNCPICLERLTIPKYLPCLHTFCEHCLQSYIESTAVNTGKQISINCPVCRKTVQCNDNDVTIGTWAKHLPLNHLICSLMDTSSKGDNSVSKLCKGCERVHESVPATSWCQQCAEALCDTCKFLHKLIKYFTNHEIVPVDTVKVTDARLLYIEEPCPYHGGKVFEVYCLDHNVLFCNVCFATQHRACSDVQSIEEVSEHVGTDSLDAFTDTITEVVEIVDRALVTKRENILSLDSEQEKITQQMVDKVQSIKAKLDSLCEEFKIASQASHLKWRTKLLSVQEVLEGVKKTAANAQSLLKAVTSKGNKKQIFVTAESLRLQLIDHMTQMEPHVDTDKEVHVKLHEATEILNLYRIQELGHVEENLSDSKYCDELKDAATKLRQHTVLVHPRPDDPPDPMLSGNPFDWTVEHCGIIDCKLEGDEEQTVISGGTFLSNENLILVDQGNRTLKAYDLSGKLLTTLLVPSQPYDATRADNPNEFFVTCSGISGWTVVKCVLSDAITIVSSFKVPYRVSGISYAGDVLVLGSDSEVYTVSVTDGTVISRAKGGNGRTWMMNHVTASCTFGRLVLVHSDGSQVVCKTTQMQEIFRYKGSLCKPRGLALDLQGNVYVCDYELHCVFQIQSDGAQCRKLPIEFKRIKQPYGIGFHPDGKTFFVIDYGNIGAIELFKLK